MDGFLIIDKSAGCTSHDVVQAVRRILGIRKVGHTGTLDPFATGVLPVAVGEATKAIPFLDEAVKEYQAVLRLGIATDTQDTEGRVVSERHWQGISPEEVRAAAARFVGMIQQVPPMFSALKREGVPLYRLARRGEEVEREPREVTIHRLTLERIELPEVAFTVRCSRGTYVRTLAADLGDRLGCGAHLRELRRTLSGPFIVAAAVSLDLLAQRVREGRVAELLIPATAVLVHLPEVPLTEQGAVRVRHGIAPEAHDSSAWPAAGVAPGCRVRLTRVGELVAVATGAEGPTLRLARVFQPS
jgi:tRNA pseudouridine55 synthase